MSTLVIQYSKLFLDIHICVIAKSQSEKILNHLIANRELKEQTTLKVDLYFSYPV